MSKYSVTNGCCFCMECMFVCPVGAISSDKDGAKIDEDKCIGCGMCAANCASEAISKVK